MERKKSKIEKLNFQTINLNVFLILDKSIFRGKLEKKLLIALLGGLRHGNIFFVELVFQGNFPKCR